MGRPSAVVTLPNAVRQELDDKLRGKGYGGLIELAQWLHRQGHATSKSALGRYSQALRLADAEAGRHVAKVSAQMRGESVTNAELMAEIQHLRRQIETLAAMVQDRHPGTHPAT